MDQAHLKRAGTVATVILGNVFYAFVIRLFLLPGNLMTGGTTGIGLVVKHFTGASISGVSKPLLSGHGVFHLSLL